MITVQTNFNREVVGDHRDRFRRVEPGRVALILADGSERVVSALLLSTAATTVGSVWSEQVGDEPDVVLRMIDSFPRRFELVVGDRVAAELSEAGKARLADWAAAIAARGTRRFLFLADGGARYEVTEHPDGEVVAAAVGGTGTVYRSHDTQTEVTGTVREQRAGRPGARTTVVGARGVLRLDTGEGISDIPGVVVGRRREQG